MAGECVSIITPVYNGWRFLDETVRSVQAQDHSNWEMIIVDDRSTDNSFSLAKKLSEKDPRIRVFQMQQNGGPALARQKALDEAEGRYLAFLDADDLWLPNKLSTQLSEMKKNSAALVFSSYRRMIQDGSVVGRLIEVPERVNYSTLLKHNVIATLTAMVDREKVADLKMVNEGYDDFILWLSILKRGHVAYGIQKDLARYRIVGKSVSRSRKRAASWVWNIYRNVEQLPMHSCLWNFANYAARVSLKHGRF